MGRASRVARLHGGPWCRGGGRSIYSVNRHFYGGRAYKSTCLIYIYVCTSAVEGPCMTLRAAARCAVAPRRRTFYYEHISQRNYNRAILSIDNIDNIDG